MVFVGRGPGKGVAAAEREVATALHCMWPVSMECGVACPSAQAPLFLVTHVHNKTIIANNNKH